MSRNYKIASLLSLTVPVALVLIPFTWLSSDTLDWSALPWLLGYWAFLSLPQLAIVLGAVIWASVRNHFATPALFLLTGLQIAYCCGIVWRVIDHLTACAMLRLRCRECIQKWTR